MFSDWVFSYWQCCTWLVLLFNMTSTFLWILIWSSGDVFLSLCLHSFHFISTGLHQNIGIGFTLVRYPMFLLSLPFMFLFWMYYLRNVFSWFNQCSGCYFLLSDVWIKWIQFLDASCYRFSWKIWEHWGLELALSTRILVRPASLSKISL